MNIANVRCDHDDDDPDRQRCWVLHLLYALTLYQSQLWWYPAMQKEKILTFSFIQPLQFYLYNDQANLQKCRMLYTDYYKWC